MTCCAWSTSSHRSGAETCVSRSAISTRLPAGSSTASIEASARSRSGISTEKSVPATTCESRSPGGREPPSDRSGAGEDPDARGRPGHRRRRHQDGAGPGRRRRHGPRRGRPTHPRRAGPAPRRRHRCSTASPRSPPGCPTAHDPLRVGVSSAGPLDGPAGTVSPVNIGALARLPARRPRPRAPPPTPPAAAPWSGSPTTGTASPSASTGSGPAATSPRWSAWCCRPASARARCSRTGCSAGRPGTRSTSATSASTPGAPAASAAATAASRCTPAGPAMVAAARERGWTGGDDARALTADARAGDPVALAVIDEGMRALAAGIATTATELDVTTFVLGGGVSRAGDVIFEPAAPPPRRLRRAPLRPRPRGPPGRARERRPPRRRRPRPAPGRLRPPEPSAPKPRRRACRSGPERVSSADPARAGAVLVARLLAGAVGVDGVVGVVGLGRPELLDADEAFRARRLARSGRSPSQSRTNAANDSARASTGPKTSTPDQDEPERRRARGPSGRARGVSRLRRARQVT